MGNRLIKNFNFKNFFEDTEFIEELEIKIKKTFYSLEVTEFINPKSIKMNLIPQTKEKNYEPAIPDNNNHVLVFRAKDGTYHIPIVIKEKEKNNSNLKWLIELKGNVLKIEKRRYQRIKIEQTTKYYLVSGNHMGIIDDLSAVGAKLLCEDEINEDKLLLDLSFAKLSFDKLLAHIVWRKPKGKEEYCYGIDFKFDNIKYQKELANWLY